MTPAQRAVHRWVWAGIVMLGLAALGVGLALRPTDVRAIADQEQQVVMP